MYLILYVVLIVIMSYFIMSFASDDKKKSDQSNPIHVRFTIWLKKMNPTLTNFQNGQGSIEPCLREI